MLATAWLLPHAVAVLLAQGRPDLDADFVAHALLAPLAADQRKALRGEVTLERLKAGLATLARSLLGSYNCR